MKDGDTFWYHICNVANYSKKPTYLPTGTKCPDCDWANKPVLEKAKIRQAEYLDELKGDTL
jgi:hypothetical protein